MTRDEYRRKGLLACDRANDALRDVHSRWSNSNKRALAMCIAEAALNNATEYAKLAKTAP